MKNHQGLDIEACQELLRITNNDGDTALHKAVRYGHHNMVKLLVKEDADFFHPPNNAGKTPLYLALEGGDEDSARLILCNSKSLSYAGPCGTTALHAAAIYNATEWQINKWLMKPRAKEDNKTPLHLAAINGKLKAMEEILEQCPDSLEAVTTQGQNVLHLVAENNKQKILLIMLSQSRFKALIFQKDVEGKTPLHPRDYSYIKKGKCLLYHPFLEKNSFKKRDNVPHRLGILLQQKTNTEGETFFLILCNFICLHFILKNCNRDNIADSKGKHMRNDKGAASWKERANTHLIVATLITTVSFAAGFTLPGGYNGDDGANKGMAILSKKAALKAFAIADTIAMISSTAAVFLHYLATYDQGTISRFRYLGAGTLVMVAMVAMVVAFTAGLYTVLPNSEGIALVICVMCSLSLVVFIILLGKRIYDEYYGFRKIEKEEGS
ncbi:ankyrin repeat-containing protein ITN1-like [Lycium barbarum]|uniref:ankyrin repeat-containing protein ITN1-like n=1 Tax=Lycium barbarum TaxID=112863 RepID=UPI00293EFC58|nr:ankyrin repeat-containing protein ITN1-like [Lycium barbarum]